MLPQVYKDPATGLTVYLVDFTGRSPGQLETDEVNSGKGKRDVLKPDRKDEHRNCERVKPK